MKKKIIVVVVTLLFLLGGLLFTDGQYWILSCLALWVLMFYLIICFLEFVCYDLFHPWMEHKLEGFSKTRFFKKSLSKNHSTQRFTKINRYIYKYVLPIMISILILIPYLTIHMGVLTHWKAEQNVSECERIAFQSIDSAFTNESKAIQILNYFNEQHSRIFNAYRLRNNYLFALDEGRIQFYSTYPYIAVRTYTEDDSCWIITSEFGHCGEYANLYRFMCHQISLRVRKVCTDGEDHCWNEVYINDSIGWKLIDATTVSSNDENNGYDNVNKTWMKQKLGGNLSYVTAKEVDGNTVDITMNYTTIVNATVKTITSNGDPISNVLIKVYSNNRYEEGRFTSIKGTTENNGEYTFLVGVGNYTFKAQKNKLTGTNSSIVSESESNISINIEMR